MLRLRRWCGQHPLPTMLLASLVLALSAAGWFAGREAHARALGETREAALAFQAGRLQASYGRWPAAEASSAQAATRGYDAIAIDLARIEIWDATFRADQSLAVLERLDQRADLGTHRAMVTLLLHDTSRHRLGLDQVPKARRARASVRAIADDASLEPAWREYARALTAESVPKAKEHLVKALALDRRHRAANEMWIPLVLLTEGPRAALDAARSFGAIYPDDPTVAFMTALLLRILDRALEAEPFMATLATEPAACRALERIVILQATIRDAWRVGLDQYLRTAFAGSGASPREPAFADSIGVGFRARSRS